TWRTLTQSPGCCSGTSRAALDTPRPKSCWRRRSRRGWAGRAGDTRRGGGLPRCWRRSPRRERPQRAAGPAPCVGTGGTPACAGPAGWAEQATETTGRVLRWCRSEQDFELRLEVDLQVGPVADRALCGLSILEDDQCRDGHDPEPARHIRVGVDVHLYELDPV